MSLIGVWIILYTLDLEKIDTTREPDMFFVFGLSIIVFWSNLC